MAATPIAEGVVIVSADAKNVPRDVARDVDTGESKVRESGDRTGRALFAGITKFAVGTVATVGTVVGGLALKGGFDRALAIQDAQKKLEGLGHDTKSIASIMDSALNSVRGTAFGLGAAATTSAGLVAAGVQLGGELERRLKTVADTATIAGRSMEDVGLIFQSVAAKGKLQGDDLLQLMSSGIPVLQFLAKHYGITAEEASEMVSRGEVDFANFADAMEENIGGAALRGGETARGAFANIGAALSRLGEKIAGPLVAGAPRLFGSIADAVDRVTQALKPMTDAFSNWVTPALEDAAQWLDSINFQAIIEGAKTFSPLITAIEILKPLLPTLQNLGDVLLPVLADVFGQVADSLAPVLPMLGEALVDAVVELVPPLADLLVALLPILPPLTDLALLILPPLIDVFGWLVDNLANSIDTFTSFFEAIDPIIKLFSGEISLAQWVDEINSITGPFATQVDIMQDFWQTVDDVLTFIGQAFDDFNTNVIQPIANNFWTAFGIAAAAVQWLYEGVIVPVIATISTSWSNFYNGVIMPVAGFIDQKIREVGRVFQWFQDSIIRPVVDTVGRALSSLYNGVIAPIASAIGGAMTGAGNTAKSAFTGVAEAVGRAFQGALNAAKGPINGLIGLINGAIRSLNGLSVTIPDWVPNVGGQTWGLDLPTIPMLAKGGVIRSGGSVMVGERGPEILNLPTGAQVTPLNRRDALPSEGGNTYDIDISITEAEDPLGSAGRVASELRMWGESR